MQAVTIAEITESLRKLPADKLIVVYDFISYLAARETDSRPSVTPFEGKSERETVSGGASIAVLLPIAEYERLVAYRRRKAAFHDFARNLGREVEERGLSEEEFMADLEKTKRKVFAEHYGRPA